MALGGTNSMGSSSGNSDINITKRYEVSFLNDQYPFMVADMIEGKYDYIKLTSTSSQTLNFSEYTTNANASLSSYYNDQSKFMADIKSRDEKFIDFVYHNSSNIQIHPTMVSFTDNQGNKKYGWRSVSFYGTASTSPGDPKYTNSNITVGRGFIDYNNAYSGKQIIVSINFSVLTWDTVNEEYHIQDVNYNNTFTNQTVNQSQYKYGEIQLTIPYTHIICGISNIYLRYNIVGVNDDTDGPDT